VPYLIGRDIDEALRIIESYGYREGDISWQNDKLPVNRVISQSPDSGREADPGARINLVVSLGEPEQENVAMPNLLGLTMEAAARQLSSNGLTMGAVTNEPSSNYVAGLVTGQQYAPETEVSRGSAVDVKVSSGAAVVTRGPRTVAIDIDFKDAPNEVFNLSVWLVDSEGRRSIALNEAVRYKSSGGDSVAVTGEGTGTVYVLFSGVQVMSFTVDFSTGAVSAI
jgi:beta-lactam-binding protein with PASTA domain